MNNYYNIPFMKDIYNRTKYLEDKLIKKSEQAKTESKKSKKESYQGDGENDDEKIIA